MWYRRKHQYSTRHWEEQEPVQTVWSSVRFSTALPSSTCVFRMPSTALASIVDYEDIVYSYSSTLAINANWQWRSDDNDTDMKRNITIRRQLAHCAQTRNWTNPLGFDHVIYPVPDSVKSNTQGCTGPGHGVSRGWVCAWFEFLHVVDVTFVGCIVVGVSVWPMQGSKEAGNAKMARPLEKFLVQIAKCFEILLRPKH